MKLKHIFYLGFAVSIAFWAIGVHADNQTNDMDDTLVLLRHGNVTVTEGDLRTELQKLPEAERNFFLTDPKKIRQLLSSLFVRAVLAQEAREAGLDQDPLVKKQSELAFQQILAGAQLDHLVAEAPQPNLEALAHEQYLANPEQFQAPEQVHVSHILISTKEQSEAEARARAEEVLALVNNGEKPFAELALEYSQDASVQQNRGDLGYIARGRMVKPFEEAAFAMQKPGEISPIVETQYGFHIIRFADRKPARQKRFEEVKKELVASVAKQQEERVRAFHLNRVRALEGVEVNQAAIDALRIKVDFDQASAAENSTQNQ
jgi:peptidyl-prolyl cis-trans isomerase C